MDKKMTLAEGWSLAKRAVVAWSDDYAPSMGAALSYYTIFSLAPLLLIVVSIAGLVFGADAARGALFGQLASMMGPTAAKAIEAMLASVSKPSSGVVGTVIGVATLLIGATTVFGELQSALDRIWRAPARTGGSSLWHLVQSRVLSFGMILGIAFLLMVSLLVSVAVEALGKWWGEFFGGWQVVAQVLTFVFGFALSTVVFAMIYKLMPRVKVRWQDVWIGAAVTAALFSLGRFIISIYIGKSGIASPFGAAGSLIIVFVWVFYSAQIFLMGAEFTWIYACTFGSMKDVAPAATAAKAAAAVPSKEEPAPPAALPAEAAPAAGPEDRAAATAPARRDDAAIKKELAGYAVALLAGVATRYAVPYLLQRGAAATLARRGKRGARSAAIKTSLR